MMEGLEKILFDASREALAKYSEAKLEYILAEREMWKVLNAQRGYYGAEPIKNTKVKEIYCGDEDTAHFLTGALGQLGYEAEDLEVFTIDGEYFVKVSSEI